MLQDKVLKLLGDAFEKETVVLVLDNSQIPSVPLYCLLGVSALFGLLGNALTYRMTRHPDLKGKSYRVHLAYLAVVDSLNLTLTIAETVTDHLQLTQSWLASQWAVCTLFWGFRYWIREMSTCGLLGLSFDRWQHADSCRDTHPDSGSVSVALPQHQEEIATPTGKLYIALVQTRFRSIVCTCTGARLMCAGVSLATFFLAIPYCNIVRVEESSTGPVCYQGVEHVYYVYITSALTGLLTCTAILYFGAHTGIVLATRSEARQLEAQFNPTLKGIAYFMCRSESTGGEQRTSNDEENGRALFAVTLVSVLTRLPKVVHDLMADILFKESLSGKTQNLSLALSVFRAKDVIAVVSCVNFSCNIYILLLTSPFFRRCTRQAMQRDRDVRSRRQEDVELPGDRRVLRTFPDGNVVECITGRTIDLSAFNQQRQRRQAAREQSLTSSIGSSCSSRQTDSEEHDLSGNGQRHGSWLGRIEERDCPKKEDLTGRDVGEIGTKSSGRSACRSEREAGPTGRDVGEIGAKSPGRSACRSEKEAGPTGRDVGEIGAKSPGRSACRSEREAGPTGRDVGEISANSPGSSARSFKRSAVHNGRSIGESGATSQGSPAGSLGKELGFLPDQANRMLTGSGPHDDPGQGTEKDGHVKTDTDGDQAQTAKHGLVDKASDKEPTGNVRVQTTAEGGPGKGTEN